ncbi:hypothetical protein ACFLIM_09415 [Nonomuraea sp. M3C6]|uniref:Uncharacterized protein n=1 Tax=Nonomuraea marmarensis TaxID=3351344 RepID=A0ABW7AAQ8_9ACTN
MLWFRLLAALDRHQLARAVDHGDGSASGRFLADDVAFMFARPHARPLRSSYLIGVGEERDSAIDPNLLDDWTGLFVAQLGAPSAEKMGAGACPPDLRRAARGQRCGRQAARRDRQRGR